MAYNIIQGFNPSTTEPIDSRQLVTNQNARYSIAAFNAYNGMIVYQQDTRVLWVLTDIVKIGNSEGWSQIGSSVSSIKQFDGLITVNKGTPSLISLYDPENWTPTISTISAGRYQIDFGVNSPLASDKTHIQISAGIDPDTNPEVITWWEFDYGGGTPTRRINLYTYAIGTGLDHNLIRNASITVKVYP